MTIAYYKLINVLQGKTARWIEGETQEHGLYTDEIATCKVFILKGIKDNKKVISMTHFDGYKDIKELESEYDWFDEVSGFYICYKPEEYDGKSGLIEYFQEVFLNEVRAIFGGAKKGCQFKMVKIPEDQDAIRVFYNPDQDFKLDIAWINSAKFKDYNIVLVNHPTAAYMYAYYKMNIMCSEIEGEMNQIKLFRNGIISATDKNNFYIYEGRTQHTIDICKKLSTPLVTQRVMFDGKSFQEPGADDSSLSRYAKFIFDRIEDSNGMDEFEEFKSSLANALIELELETFPTGHTPKNWFEDNQAVYIALNYLYALGLNTRIELPDQYMNMIDRYGYKFNCKREIELIKAELTPGCKYYSSNDESSVFFSLSKFATKEQPYGPYADHLCLQDDYADKLTKLTIAISR